MEPLWQDLCYGFRRLLRTPGFTAVAVLTLALGIGANTAIFSMVNAILMQSLPYREPDRLVVLFEGIPKIFSDPIPFSAPDYIAFEERARSFEAMAAYQNKTYELSGSGEPERVMGARVSPSLFSVLGVQPILGRTFTLEEDRQQLPVVILSHGLWRRKLGADPAIIGSSIQIDRKAHTVVGVLPQSFVFPNRGPVYNNTPAQLYVPISFTEAERQGFGMMYRNSVIARLRRDVTLGQAASEVRLLAKHVLDEVYPPVLRFDLSASVGPYRDEVVGRIQTLLWVLFGSVAVVLLIACVNLANLMLTRAATRERELAVRTALGAGRLKLVQLMLGESLMLALAGGALGLLVASWGTTLLVTFAPVSIPLTEEIRIDLTVLAFTVLLSVLAALLFGAGPSFAASPRGPAGIMKEGGRTLTPGRRGRRIFETLVTAEVALALVLLVAGGLLVRSFLRLMATDPGFRPESVLTLSVSLPSSGYSTAGEIRSFYERLLESVAALPGVKAAAASTFLPLDVRERRVFSIENQPAASADLSHAVANEWVMGEYFQALGIELKRGRFLTPLDREGSERVILVNETMAKRFWPGQEAIGQRIKWGLPVSRAPWMRIVGIVSDVKQGPLDSETLPQTYQPYLQEQDVFIEEKVTGIFRSLSLIVRSEADPEALVSAVQAEIRSLDPSLPIANVQTMEQILRTSTAPQRFNTYLLAIFASVGLALAALGIGGVLAISVSRRTHEIGVRMALGADRRQTLRMVLRQGLSLAGLGLVIGLAVSLLLSRLLSSLLFGIGPRDPWTFLAVAVLLMGVALVASYIPARRAASVDPMVALRYE